MKIQVKFMFKILYLYLTNLILFLILKILSKANDR